MKKYSEFLKFYQKEALFTNYKIEDTKLFEATDSFSNGIGFAESLVGRAINGLFSMFGKNVNKRRLASYRKDLENEYLAGVVRACIANNMSSNEITNAEDKYINWVMSIKQPNKLTCWNINMEGFKPLIELDANSSLPETQYIKIELFKAEKSIVVIEEKTLTRSFTWDGLPAETEDGNDYKVRITVYNNNGESVSNIFIDSDVFVISTIKDEQEFIKYIKENFQKKWDLENEKSTEEETSTEETSTEEEPKEKTEEPKGEVKEEPKVEVKKETTEPNKGAREIKDIEKEKTWHADKTTAPAGNNKQITPNENVEKINNLKECLKKKNDVESQKKFYSEIADIRAKYKDNPNFTQPFTSKKTGKEFTGASLIDDIMKKTQEGQFENLSEAEINTILKKLEFIHSLTKKDALIKTESTIHKYFEFLLEKELNFLAEGIGEEIAIIPKKDTTVATIPKKDTTVATIQKDTETQKNTETEEKESELSELANKKVIAENKIIPKYKEFESKGGVGPKISAKGGGKGESIQTLLGDNIPPPTIKNRNFKNNEHYKQWANIKLDELDSPKLAKIFNNNPELKKNATASVNTQGVALIQLSAERLFKKSEKYEGKTSGDYYPNVRQNFIVKPRDKEILESIWRQHVLKVKGMFRDYLDMNALDPFKLLKQEKGLEADTANVPLKSEIRENNDAIAANFKGLSKEDVDILGVELTKSIENDNYGIILAAGVGIIVYKFQDAVNKKLYYYKYCGLVDINSVIDFVKTEKDKDKIKDKIKELKYNVADTFENNKQKNPQMAALYQRFRVLKGNQKDDINVMSAIFSTGLNITSRNFVIAQYNKVGNNWNPYITIQQGVNKPDICSPDDALNYKDKEIIYDALGTLTIWQLPWNSRDLWQLDVVGTTKISNEKDRNKEIMKFTDKIIPVYKKIYSKTAI